MTGGDTERILEGTGVSADRRSQRSISSRSSNIQPERLQGAWEGLAVKIAENKAVDALRASGKGLARH